MSNIVTIAPEDPQYYEKQQRASASLRREWTETEVENFDTRERMRALKKRDWSYESINRVVGANLADRPFDGAVAYSMANSNKALGGTPFPDWLSAREFYDHVLETRQGADKEEGMQFCFGSLSGRELHTVSYGGQPTGMVRRGFKNCRYVTGAGFDIDDGKVTVAEVVERLGKLGIEAIVYTTHSHTEECPRLRILLVFRTPYLVRTQEDWKRWKLYYDAMIRLLELDDVVDPACKDPLRWHRAPIHAPGAPFERVFVEGKPLDWETLKLVERTRPRREPLQNTDINNPELVEALNCIDPSCDYPVWYNVILAIHSEFGETEHDETALALLDEWSSRSTEKYDDEAREQLETLWEYARIDGGIAIGTFWHIAFEHGHDRDRYQQKQIAEADIVLSKWLGR